MDYFAKTPYAKAEHEESLWGFGLRIVAWINLISGIIGGFFTAHQLGTLTADFGQNMNWVIYFIALLTIFIATFLSTAVIMVFLDMARDISATKYHSANTHNDIVEIKMLLEKEKK